MKAYIEYTDTFAGEANYTWCQRHEFDCTGMTDVQIMRKAKKFCNLSGVRGKVQRIGDTTEFRPYKMCTVLFITIQESF